MAGRSLGTLTLDLVAKVGGFTEGLSKAERSSGKWRKKTEKDLKDVGKAFAAMGVAAASGLVYITQDLARSSRELRTFADLSNSSTQQFQRLAFGASRYQVEQEKVADILKDTNDRIGDFLQTGGGPMADFFENIAPLVGVTAEEMAKLSGPDALQLYVSSLEAANLSQSEMVFYMEAIAGDSAKLLPLLRDNGKEMRALGDEAERTGNVLSDIDIENLDKVSRSVEELSAQFTGVKNEVALAALPAVNDLIDVLSDPETIKAAKAIGDAIVTSVTAATKAIAGAANLAGFLGEELAALVNGPAIGDAVRIDDRISEVQDRLAKLREQEESEQNSWVNRMANMQAGATMASVGRIGEVSANAKAEIQSLEKELDSLLVKQELTRDLVGSNTEDPLSPVVAAGTRIERDPIRKSDRDSSEKDGKRTEAINKEIEALARAVDLYGESERQIALYDLAAQGATEADLARADALLSQLEVFEKLEDEQKELTKSEEEAADKRIKDIQSIVDLLPEQERETRRLLEQQEFLNQAMRDYPAMSEDIAAALAEVEGRISKIGETTDEMSVYAEQAARNMQSAFADFLFDPFDDGLDGLAKNFATILQRMAAEAAAAKIFESMGFGGSGGGSSGSSSAGGWIGAIGSLLSFDGGGYTGSGSRSGGMDGKGGYLAMLHPDETVIDHRVKDSNVDMAAMRADRISNNSVSVGQMVFPGITSAREAKMASGQAGRQLMGAVNNAQRFS